MPVFWDGAELCRGSYHTSSQNLKLKARGRKLEHCAYVIRVVPEFIRAIGLCFAPEALRVVGL